MIFLVGASFGALVMTLGDRIGRKKTYDVGLLLIVLGFTSGLVFDTYWSIILGYGLAMAGGDIVFSLAFIYLNESLGTRLRIMSNALMFSSFSLGEIVFNGGKFFLFNTYEELLWFNLVCGALTFIPAYFNLESPMFLSLSKKNQHKLLSWLVCVSKRNSLDREGFLDAFGLMFEPNDKHSNELLQDSKDLTEHGITERGEANLETETHQLVKENDNQYSCTWEDIRSLILISLVFANTYIIYQATLYSSSTIGVSDARINGILFGASEMVVYLTVVPISHKLKRKTTVIFTCLIGLIGSGVLVPISDFVIPQPSSLVKVLRTLVSGLLIRIVSCINYAFIFGYAAELFPTKIRALMCGLATYVGRLSGAISPQIVTLAISYKLEPLVFCSFVSIPIVLMSGYLKETLNKPLS